MNIKDRKTLFLTIAAATAVICVVALFFFRMDVVIGVVKKGIGILTPFIYGAVMAYLLRPVCLFFEKQLGKLLDRNNTGKHAGRIRMLSILLSLVLLFACLILLLLLVVPELITSISGLISHLPQALERFETWLASLDNGETSHEIVSSIQTSLDTLSDRLFSFLQTDVLPHLQTVVTNVTSSFMGILTVAKNFGLGCIISAYILGSWERFVCQCKLIVYAVFSKQTADWIKKEIRFMDRMFSGFIHGKLLDSLIIGILCFLFTSIAGMPYAMLVSVIVGVTNVIPFFGPYLGAIPSAILILTVSPGKCVVFLIFIIILQQFDGNLLGPAILGDRLGLSGFWILFSILVFGALWGVVGMLIGAPVFAVLYDLIRSWITAKLRKREEIAMLETYDRQFHPPAEEKSGSVRQKIAEIIESLQKKAGDHQDK